MNSISPSEGDVQQRDAVLQAIITTLQTSNLILLPRPSTDGGEGYRSVPGSNRALSELPAPLPALLIQNQYGGQIGPFYYQFESEEDLVHLIVAKTDFSEITVEEARLVVDFVLPFFPAALLWLKPGQLSQHFYFGNTDFLDRAPKSATA